MKPITILITDDHAIVRTVLKLNLNSDPRFLVVAECENGEQAIEKVQILKPDVVLMDINMPGINGFEALQKIMKNSPDSKVIGISMYTDPVYVKGMFDAGASGYVSKSSNPQQIFNAILTVNAGNKYLSDEIITSFKNTYSDYHHLLVSSFSK